MVRRLPGDVIRAFSTLRRSSRACSSLTGLYNNIDGYGTDDALWIDCLVAPRRWTTIRAFVERQILCVEEENLHRCTPVVFVCVVVN